jgi:GNAT superfamily N-acetyltransferase
MSDVDVHIAAESFTGHGPQSIVLAALDEFDRLYGHDGRGAHDLSALDFEPPSGVYLVAREDGQLAGGVGLRQIADPTRGIGEVKRLWVRPDLRRHGVARQLMDAIVAEALARRYVELYLETGPLQPAAHQLYDRLGWERVERYPEGAHVHDTGFRFHHVL